MDTLRVSLASLEHRLRHDLAVLNLPSLSEFRKNFCTAISLITPIGVVCCRIRPSSGSRRFIRAVRSAAMERSDNRRGKPPATVGSSS